MARAREAASSQERQTKLQEYKYRPIRKSWTIFKTSWQLHFNSRLIQFCRTDYKMTLPPLLKVLPPHTTFASVWWGESTISPDAILHATWLQAQPIVSQMRHCIDTGRTNSSLVTGQAFFFAGGCHQRDGSTNCSAACESSQQLFSNVLTMWNCFALTQFSELPMANFSDRACSDLYEQLQAAGEPVGVPFTHGFDRIGVAAKFLLCANYSCATDESSCHVPRTILADGTPTGDYITKVSANLCHNFTPTINVDIAGPGVSIVFALIPLSILLLRTVNF